MDTNLPDNKKNSRSGILESLIGDLLYFVKFFYQIRTGNYFNVGNPVGRQPRQITICDALTETVRSDVRHLLINVQPGAGKSELLIHYVAWCLAQYPDSKFLYLAHTKSLAESHTYTIKQILSLPIYKKLFGVELRKDSSAKGAFKTTAGGSVMAFGSSGAITGQDAGLPGLDRFSGALIYDDAHKPDEVHSDVLRRKVIRNYSETARPRLRGVNVPIIYIGQRLHEDDLSSYFLSGSEGHDWKKVILKTLDDAGNNLCPDIIPDDELRILQETSPYAFSSQYQQDPMPSGGALFKIKDFPIHDEMPDILATFITCDTAETAKEYNDATVFSFWGLYHVKHDNIDTGILALCWLDCSEVWVEPRDLKPEFLQFYAECMRFPVKPSLCAIEKKSTGTTLVSILKDMQGLNILEVERTRASGSKSDRFINAQPSISSKLVSFVKGMGHVEKCISHMSKITANDTHRYDDIADTCVDAIRLGLTDRVVLNRDMVDNDTNEVINTFKNQFIKRDGALGYGSSNKLPSFR